MVYIELILGPMFSGKTTDLLRKYEVFQNARLNVLLIKHKGDNRYSEECVATHNGEKIKAVKAEKLFDLSEEVKNTKIICIDEGHFFVDLVDFCLNMSSQGKKIFVAGLDSTFQRKPFENITNLVAHCNKVTKLTAICRECGDDAIYSMRIKGGLNVIEVGGGELYQPTCRRCHK